MRTTIPFLALLASALALVIAPNAAAAETQCVGFVTGTHDNVVVPPGQTCTLSNATVLGNVKALQDSRILIVRGNVRGNVEGDKADLVQVQLSTVGGNITVKEGGPAAAPVPPGFFFCITPAPGPCEVLVIDTTLESGNIHVEKMRGDIVVNNNGLLSPIRGNIQIYDNFIEVNEFIGLSGNSVMQNVQLFKNTGPGSRFVISNTVRGNLQCFENDGGPFVNFGNVARKVEGQCTAAPLPVTLTSLSAVPVVRAG